MLNSQEDIDVFFQSEDFAESVTYTHSGDAPVSVKCIWDEPFQLTSAQGITYQNSDPNALFRSVDVPTPTDQDTVVRNSVTYYVLRSEPDGTGCVRLFFSTTAPQQ